MNKCSRRGITLVHLQSAIAVMAVAVATVSTTFTALYRMQRAADEIRERDATSYRFEQQFRDDAHLASTAEVLNGELKFSNDQNEVVYSAQGDWIVRTTNADGQTPQAAMALPQSRQVEFSVDQASGLASLTIITEDKYAAGVFRIQSRIAKRSDRGGEQ